MWVETDGRKARGRSRADEKTGLDHCCQWCGPNPPRTRGRPRTRRRPPPDARWHPWVCWARRSGARHVRGSRPVVWSAHHRGGQLFAGQRGLLGPGGGARFPSPVCGGDVGKPRPFKPVSVLLEVTGRGRVLGMNGRSRAPVVGPGLRHPRPASPRTLVLSPMAPAPRPTLRLGSGTRRRIPPARQGGSRVVVPRAGCSAFSWPPRSRSACSPRRRWPSRPSRPTPRPRRPPPRTASAARSSASAAPSVGAVARPVGQHAGSRWSSSTGSPATRPTGSPP